MHGLACLCHEAGNGGNNGRHCHKHVRTIFLPDLDSIQYERMQKNKSQIKDIYAGHYGNLPALKEFTMKSRNLVAASVVLFLVFLFTITGFCAGDGKVTMDQWIKIIESKGVKSPPPAKTTETKNTGDIYRPDSSTPPGASGIDVTVYWHMADVADVYLNGKPLRRYEPSFKTRPDEAPRPAFSASAILRNGDVFTVGGRRGGSFGFMLIAVDAAGKVVFQSDQQSWNVYDPGEKPDWFSPSVAIASGIRPVTVQPDPWYPQKELNAKYGNKAISIWSNPSNIFAYLYGIVGDSRAPEKSRTTDSDVPKIKADSGTQRFEGEKRPLSGKPGAATETVISGKPQEKKEPVSVPPDKGNVTAVQPQIPIAEMIIIAASDALATGDIPLFNKSLSKSTGGIGSLSSEKAKAIADAIRNAKMISEDGVGMKTWEMIYNGEKLTFTTILEDGEWKLISAKWEPTL